MPASSADAQSQRLAARLRFRHLQILLALEQAGSLRAAAQVVNLTQPALSKSLGEIEAAFGHSLFTRTARGVTPTPRGALALRGARLLIEELAHVQREVASAAAATVVIRIGAPPFVAQDYLPRMLRRLVRSQPPVRVELVEERVPALLQALVQGRVDALVSSYPWQLPDDPGTTLNHQRLFDMSFIVIAPPAQRPKQRRVDWATLARRDWIMPAHPAMGRRVIEEGFMRAGVTPPVPIVESSSPVTNVRLVAAGIGWSVAPASTVKAALAMGTVARINVYPAIPPGPVALIWRGGADNPRLELLRKILIGAG
jgi:LysR family transcriptional regulator of abg operon